MCQESFECIVNSVTLNLVGSNEVTRYIGWFDGDASPSSCFCTHFKHLSPVNQVHDKHLRIPNLPSLHVIFSVNIRLIANRSIYHVSELSMLHLIFAQGQ